MILGMGQVCRKLRNLESAAAFWTAPGLRRFRGPDDAQKLQRAGALQDAAAIFVIIAKSCGRMSAKRFGVRRASGALVGRATLEKLQRAGALQDAVA